MSSKTPSSRGAAGQDAVFGVQGVQPGGALDPRRSFAGGRSFRSVHGVPVYIIGELANKLIRFVAAVILARDLSVSDYGLVNVGIAVSGVTVMAVTLGLSDLGARDVAIKPGRASWIAGRVLFVRLIGVVAVGLVLFLAALVGKGSLAPLVIATSLMSLATASSSEWILRGTERLGLLGIADFLGGAAVTVGCVLLAITHATSLLAVGVFALGEAVTAGACWVATGRSTFPQFGARGLSGLLRRSWPIGISSVAVYAYYANVDTIILAGTRSEREAGLYTAAYRLFLAANIAGLAAAYSQLPSLSRAVARGDDSEASASFRQILVLLACYGCAVVGVVSIGGRMILQTLYGSRYVSMSPVLVVLCMGVAWYAVGFPAGYTLIARGRNRGFLAGSATAACVNLTLDVVLIPPFGPIGAAIATFAAFLAGALVWLYAHKMLDRAGLLMVGALTIVSCGGIMGLLVSATRVPVGLVTVAGSLLFAVKAWRRAPLISIFQRA
jgi:O-antigen/teichoic acid export membrane protein